MYYMRSIKHTKLHANTKIEKNIETLKLDLFKWFSHICRINITGATVKAIFRTLTFSSLFLDAILELLRKLKAGDCAAVSGNFTAGFTPFNKHKHA